WRNLSFHVARVERRTRTISRRFTVLPPHGVCAMARKKSLYCSPNELRATAERLLPVAGARRSRLLARAKIHDRNAPVRQVRHPVRFHRIRDLRALPWPRAPWLLSSIDGPLLAHGAVQRAHVSVFRRPQSALHRCGEFSGARAITGQLADDSRRSAQAVRRGAYSRSGEIQRSGVQLFFQDGLEALLCQVVR